MIDKQEEELIIKNAIEFLKRDNLIADINDKIISLDFCLNTYWEIYKIKLDDEKDCLLVYIEPRRYPIEISSDNKELYDLFNETYNRLTEHKSFFSKELEKKANCNCENEPVCSKCVEHSEINNTKQDADINIPNKCKYRRKSDGKIFFLISQHELKTTMNGITPSKEICEIVVDITKIYVLFSPVLEGRYNHDILYVKENELNEDYEMLSED